MMAFCREGERVVAHSLDRLGRDIRDLLNIVEELNDKGATVALRQRRRIMIQNSYLYSKKR
jgi:DNA invertase Pin-like site-specific DNA recombinase